MTASGQSEQSETDVEHTSAAEPEMEIAAAQNGELGKGGTSAGGPVEEELPGGQLVEQPTPVGEGFWASLIDNWTRLLKEGEKRKDDCRTWTGRITGKLAQAFPQ
jgi:hypothetical protein